MAHPLMDGLLLGWDVCVVSGCAMLLWNVVTQSHQRRLSRWLHNPRINVQRLYSPIIQAALSKWGSKEIVLIEDTSMLWNRYCLIRVSVRYPWTCSSSGVACN
jgi:hypothetical protein